MANITKDAKNIRVSRVLHAKLKRAASGETLFTFMDRVIIAGLRAIKQERR